MPRLYFPASKTVWKTESKPILSMNTSLHRSLRNCNFAFYKYECCSTTNRNSREIVSRVRVCRSTCMRKRVELAEGLFASIMQAFSLRARRGKDRAPWPLYCKRAFGFSFRILDEKRIFFRYIETVRMYKKAKPERVTSRFNINYGTIHKVQSRH